MACFLPFRPGISPNRRVFGTWNRRVKSDLPSPNCSSLALLRPPQRFALPLAASVSKSHADHDPSSGSTSRKLYRPSAYSDPFALLFTRPSGPASLEPAMDPRKCHPQGLATLPMVSALYGSLETSFSPQRSWAFPFRALLLFDDQDEVTFISSALALFYTTFRPRIGASAMSSRRKSRSPHCPQVIHPGRGHLLSWAFGPLQLSLRSAPEVSSPHLCPVSPLN
jgi:hypothetical protein